MKEIALAGLVMTVEEWQSLDGFARAEIVAAVMQWDSISLPGPNPASDPPSHVLPRMSDG